LALAFVPIPLVSGTDPLLDLVDPFCLVLTAAASAAASAAACAFLSLNPDLVDSIRTRLCSSAVNTAHSSCIQLPRVT
jgi:hypothetical protein